MKRLLHLLVLFLIWTGIATAQTAVVKRKVNLRSEASTASTIIEGLKVGSELRLVESDKTNGFYHVTAADGQGGWVWARNITISGAASTPAATPSTPSGDLFAQLMSARKPAVAEPLIENGSEVCGPTGDATNATAIALNTNKNRTDVPGESDYVDVGWSDLKSLPSNRVKDFVSAPVRVVGFLSHKINVENSGKGESTNCHLTGDNEVDWHIYLTDSPAQQIRSAIIVETTPRTRPQHAWSTSMLAPLVDSQTQVRISGWLMFDTEHINVIGTQRATVWEVHPITKIEVRNNGQWVDLDNHP
jgi:hypothetical protein